MVSPNFDRSTYNFPSGDELDEERLGGIRANLQAKPIADIVNPMLPTPSPEAPVPLTNQQKLDKRITMPPVDVTGQAGVPPQPPTRPPVGRRGTNLGRAGNILKKAYTQKEEAIGAQAELAAAQAEADRAKLNQDAELARTATQREIIENEQYIKDKNDLQATQQEEQVEKQKAVTDRIGKLDEARDAAKAELKDPWSEKSVMSKIGLTIGAALIGYAGGLRGDPSAGVRVIQGVLDRDIARQKANLANKRATVKDEQTAVGLARQQFSDGKTQDLAAQKVLWESVQDKMELMKLKALPAQQQANLDQQLAAVDVKTKAIDSELRLSIAENEVTSAKDQIGIAQEQDRQRMQRAQMRQSAMMKQIELEQKKENKRPVSEATAKQLGELNGAEELVDSLESNFDENTSFASALTKHIPGTPSSDYESTRDAFVQHMARGIYGATPPVAEINAIKKLIPSATEWSAKAPTMFEGLRALARDKKTNMLHSLSTGGFDVGGYLEQEDVSSFKSN